MPQARQPLAFQVPGRCVLHWQLGLGVACGWLPDGYTASGLDPALQWLILKHRLDLCDSWSSVGVQVLQLWVDELEAWLERCEGARFEVQLARPRLR